MFGGGLLLPPHATMTGTIAVAPSATSPHVLTLRFSFIAESLLATVCAISCGATIPLLQRASEGGITPGSTAPPEADSRTPPRWGGVPRRLPGEAGSVAHWRTNLNEKAVF